MPSVPKLLPRRRAATAALGLLVVAAAGSVFSLSTSSPADLLTSGVPLSGIHKIQHVVVIMQENRSFDSYFGTYPGADGIPRQNGRISVCLPDPSRGGCVRPFHDYNLSNGEGPHNQGDTRADANGGRMDGFLSQAEKQYAACYAHRNDPTNPACVGTGPTGATRCPEQAQYAGTPSIWNPLPAFDTVQRDHQAGNVKPVSHLFSAASDGSLPAVSWVVPYDKVSEHGPWRVDDGQAYVTRIVNAILSG